MTTHPSSIQSKPSLVAAPITNTRKPTFLLPPLACDAHCHVFGPGSQFPYAPNRKYTPPDAGKTRLKQLHSVLGIERAVLVQASCHGTDNRAMIDAIAQSEGTWRGVCIANRTFSIEDFEQLHEGGVRGVRFNFVSHLGGAPDLDEMREVVDRVAPLGWHLVVHVNACDLLQYAAFFSEFELPLVIDHMGRVPANEGIEQPAFETLLNLVRRENRWVKISGAERISTHGAPFHDVVPFAHALIDVAPDRVLWGTDFPHPNVKVMPNDGDLVDLLPHFLPDESLRQKVLVANPDRLYWSE